MSSLRVGVVGCGTAGAAAALLLARAGHAVTILERVPEPGPVGAGITLQPTGKVVLARLGLLEPVLARAARIDRLVCRTAGGRTIVDLRYADLGPSLAGAGVHRGVLFETLLAAVRAEPGVTLRCGVAVESMTEWIGGARFLEAGGERIGPFDLVVVADGAVSELHATSPIPFRARPYAWGALWFVAVDPDPNWAEIDQVVDGARRMCGLLPTGRAPRGDAPVLSLFWSLRADRVAAWRDAGLDAWKRDVVRLMPRTAPVIDQIIDADQVVFARYRDVRMRRWHDRGVVFLGDAAHATSPQLGQGANLALWDAMVLADCVAAATADQRVEASARADVAAAAYTAARRAHLRYYQMATRLLTPLFQSDSRLLGWLRDLTFPLANRVGPLQRRMVRTMAGLDRGIVRPPLQLPQGGGPPVT